MSIEVMRQALEALERHYEHELSLRGIARHEPAITALRTAIAEAEKQEPFGYFQYAPHFDAWVQNRDSNKGVAFYTTPHAAQRQPLTDEEIDAVCAPLGFAQLSPREVARAIEAEHGIGEKK